MNVTLLPEQIDVELAVIDTDGVTEPAVMLIPLLVAVVGFAQGSVLVITTVTASPFASDEVVNVGELVPVFTPFICH